MRMGQGQLLGDDTPCMIEHVLIVVDRDLTHVAAGDFMRQLQLVEFLGAMAAAGNEQAVPGQRRIPGQSAAFAAFAGRIHELEPDPGRQRTQVPMDAQYLGTGFDGCVIGSDFGDDLLPVSWRTPSFGRGGACRNISRTGIPAGLGVAGIDQPLCHLSGLVTVQADLAQAGIHLVQQFAPVTDGQGTEQLAR